MSSFASITPATQGHPAHIGNPPNLTAQGGIQTPSSRIEAILSHISCRTLADIGTGHGLTPAAACLRGLAERAIACDISRATLCKAESHFQGKNLTARIETRLGPGFSPIAPGEADMAVVSGMGGMTIREILLDGIETVKPLRRIILGPQRDAPALRQSLCEMGIIIVDEGLVMEKGIFYNILVCEPGPPQISTPEGIMFGQALIDKHDPALKERLKRLLQKNRRILSHAHNKLLQEETRLAEMVMERNGWA